MIADYDAIVIGGGHNGLTAAAYLAQAGRRVLVVEALDRLGGFCTTDAYAPDSPGFQFSPHAMDHVLMAVEPSVATELQLDKFGLDYIEVDPFGGWIDASGNRIVLWRDLDKTLKSLAELSPPDAAAYKLLTEQGRALWRVAVPYLMGHPTKPGMKTIARTIKRALGSHRMLLEIGRLALQPADAMIRERFIHPSICSLMTNLAASGGVPTDASGSAILATVLALEHDSGVLRPRGGSGKLIEALASYVIAHGGNILTGQPVRELVIKDGAVVGVLVGDQRFRSSAVLAAIDPVSLAEKVIGLDRLPAHTRKELNSLGQYRANLGMGSIGARLRSRPRLPRDAEPDSFLGASLYLGGDVSEMQAAIAQARAGEIPESLPLWLILPSVLDRSLVPPGSLEETAYFYLPVLPRRLSNRLWADCRSAVYNAAMATADRHLPGLSDLVASSFVHTPDDLVGWSYDNRGGPYHADLTLDQLGPWRPIKSFSGYRTPINGLYHAGAGAHPLGTINGWSGRSAARMILQMHRSFRGV